MPCLQSELVRRACAPACRELRSEAPAAPTRVKTHSRLAFLVASGLHAGVMLLVFAALLAPAAAEPPHAGPSALDPLRLGFGANDLRAVERGEVRAVFSPLADERDIRLQALIRVPGPFSALLDLFRDSGSLTRIEAVEALGRISGSNCAGDSLATDALVLTPDELRALRTCERGDCSLKLSARMLATLRDDVPWDHPQAERLAADRYRELLTAYVAEYRQRGNAALLTYTDREQPQAIEENLRWILSHAPHLWESQRELCLYLLGFPHNAPPGSAECVYGSRRKVGPKWLVTVTQLLLLPADADSGRRGAIALKQLYANHYFQGALEVYEPLPDAGGRDGGDLLLLATCHYRIDPPHGPLAGLQRQLIERQARGALEARLERMRELVARER